MSNPIINYFFKCDSFDFNFRLLILGGFWPFETKKKWVQTLFSIYSFLCVFSPVSMFFIQILDLYLLRNDPYNFTKNLCFTSVTFAAVVKHVLIFYKVEQIMKLDKQLQEFRKSRVDPEILERTDKSMAKAIRSMYGLAIPCVIVWMIYPWLESSKQKGVPFPYRLPTEDWSTPIYEILYTYQSLSMIGFMFMVLSEDLVYYGMVIRINGEYDMLIKKLATMEMIVESNLNNNDMDDDGEALVKDLNITENIKSIVKNCSVFHQKILTEIDELKIIYGKPYLIHFISAVTLVGTIIIDLILVSKGFKLQMLQRVTYSATGVCDTFFCCYFTTEMQEKSYALRRAIYSTPWYKINYKIRKDLMLISTRSIKAPAVRVGNYFPLNLETFLEFLKLSYNVTTVLYQTVRR